MIKGISSSVDGNYIVKDVTNLRVKNTVDILVNHKHSKLYGLWKIQIKKL